MTYGKSSDGRRIIASSSGPIVKANAFLSFLIASRSLCDMTDISKINVVARNRLFPTHPPNPTSTPLSILDATVLRFAQTAAIWTYERAPSMDHLMTSFIETLDAYPQWAGQLRWSSCNPQGDHTQRQGRLMLAYGLDSDPGVEYIISSTSCSISSLLPTNDGYNDIKSFPSMELLSADPPLALHNAVDYIGLPCMVVQVTAFADGGVSIAIKLPHSLADAHTLLRFVHDWASTNRAMMTGNHRPIHSPIFNPSLIDRAAAGDIDAPQPDAALLKISNALPLHRYDCWASAAGCPDFLALATIIPPFLRHEDVGPMGHPIPWHEWDATAPVSRYAITFDPSELQAMWEEASSVCRVSHLDALLAHIWGLIIRAQEVGYGEEHYLDVTFNLRSRLSPKLPNEYLGSPLTLAKVTSTGGDATSNKLGKMAGHIRSSLQSFSSDSLPAFLHEMTFLAGAQRLWSAFFGRRHTIVTSWLRLGVRDVDFGMGTPNYVDAVMPSCDGVVQVMEARGKRDSTSESGQWYNDTVIVSLCLREDVMQRLLKDPVLRRYRS